MKRGQKSLDDWFSKPKKKLVEIEQVQDTVVCAPDLLKETEPKILQPNISLDDLLKESISSTQQPYHCDPEFLPVQTLKTRVLTFQNSWYVKFPWLHSIQNHGVVCYFCAKLCENNLNAVLPMSKETTFRTSCFSNWKKAMEKFHAHEGSKAHKSCVLQLKHIAQSEPIESQLSNQSKQEQQKARVCLEKVVSSLKYLCRQGLAIRGHSHDEGNFMKLLELRCGDVSELKEWMCRKKKFTSWEIQNEILEMFSGQITRKICSEINAQVYPVFSIIVDGTHDITGKDQQSICIRYVDQTLTAREEFIGFYLTEETTGKKLSEIILDALCRLQLPINLLRGQAYDGAANMSGEYKGTQKMITDIQPLALFVHCGAHCCNLVTEAVCLSCPALKSSLELVHEIGVLFGQSGKFRVLFESIATSKSGSFTTLKPLCPTRWTVRLVAVQAILTQYESVLNALEEMADHHLMRASGLLERLRKGSSVVGMCFAEDILQPLQVLNKSLQSQTQTVCGMLKSVQIVKATLESKRNERYFKTVFERAMNIIDSMNLDPLELPRPRNPPKRFCGNAENYRAKTPEEYYKIQFLQILDTATVQLTERFHQKGFIKYGDLEDCLLKGVTHQNIASYPEFDKSVLTAQLAMFRQHYKYSTTAEAVQIIKDMLPEVKRLFSEVIHLIRLLLTVPASTCEAERSFSALRRLKTYLRSTMSQQRLNAVAVCHVHQDVLDSVNIDEIMKIFSEKHEERRRVFGKW